MESTKKIAVAIAGFNRPACFQATLESLLANTFLKECDLWAFFDGGNGHCQREYSQIIENLVAQSTFPPASVHVVARPNNYGCGRNLIDLRRRIFDEEGYESAFIFEDDMVVSPTYLSLSKRLLDWAQSNFDNIGAVQPYNFCRLSAEQKVYRLDEVTVGNPHWWGYLMPRSVWKLIRDTLYEFEDRFLRGLDYRNRDGDGIRAWAKDRLQTRLAEFEESHDMFQTARRYPVTWNYRRYFEKPFATGQDSMTVLSMTLAGLQKLTTVVNRGQPIGVEGLHSTRASFEESGLHKVVLDNFESDAWREGFRICHDGKASLRPWMRADEVEAIHRVIHERKPRRVLEFGSGGSTVTFGRDPGIDEWWTIEDSPEWLAQVSAALTVDPSDNITVVSCSSNRVLDRLRQLLPIGFDLFLVDGFDRCAILEALRSYLADHSGCVLLHDASREAYRCAIEQFPKRVTLTEGNGKHQGIVMLEVD